MKSFPTYEKYNGIESPEIMIDKQNEIQEATDKKNKVIVLIGAVLLIGMTAVSNVSKGTRTDENVTSDIARVTR